MVFSRQQELPVDIGAFLKIRYEENRRVIEGVNELLHPSIGQKEEVFVRWSHPPQDWYVLNVDGAAKGALGATGGGAIIRNHNGQFISALSANFGHCTSFKAEAAALVCGLELAKNMQIEKLVVQMDNLACVQVLRSKKWGSLECTHLFEHSMKLIECPSWMVKIVHGYREGNRAADWLANQGVTQHIRLQILSSAPVELSRIIREDAMGVTTPRLVPL